MTENTNTTIEWIREETKRCCTCKEYKAFNEFHKDKTGIAGLTFSCRLCAIARSKAHYARRIESDPEFKAKMKDRYINRVWNLSRDAYQALLKKQNSRCAICGTDEPKGGWHLDHNHDTGRLREFLCNPCNRGIGYLQDDPMLLMKAIEYLDKHNDYVAVESEGRGQ